MIPVIFCASTSFAPVLVKTFSFEMDVWASHIILMPGGELSLSFPERGNFRYDLRKRKLQQYAVGSHAISQSDCGQGLAAFFRIVKREETGRGRTRESGFLDVYQISDGKKLSSIEASWSHVARIGGLVGVTEVQASGQKWEDRSTSWIDARTGRLLGRTQKLSVVWDSPALRLMIANRIYGPDKKYGPPYYSLLQVRSGSFETQRHVAVGPFEQGFDMFIGSPMSLPFGLEFSFVGVGVESFSYSVVRDDFTALAKTIPKVWDVSPKGILASMTDNGYPEPRGRERYPDLVCLDSRTGAQKWKRKRIGVPKWMGSFAVEMAEEKWTFRNASNGNAVRALTAPGLPIAQAGHTFLFDRGAKNRREFSVWKLRL